MKAIATAPNKLTKYVELTVNEKKQRANELVKIIAEKPMKDWLSDMQTTDSTMPRYTEDIIDAMDTATRARVDSYTIAIYDNKKLVRARRPV